MSRVRITFGDLEEIHRKMCKVMDEVFTRQPLGMGHGWRPAVDIYEDEGHVVLVAELAGVEPADIEITLDAQVVRIAGSRRATAAPPGGAAPVRFFQLEIDHGRFERLFRLPVPVEEHGASATLRDGYLRLDLPKKKPAEARRVTIEES
jgi:HSP20 family protein